MNTPLVIFSSQDFDDLPTRKHRLAKRFAANGQKVLYIEAPFTYLSALKDPTYKPKLLRAGKVVEAEKNLFVASPPPMMPFYGRFGIMQKMACATIANFAQSAMKKVGFPKEFAALFYLPWMTPIVGKVKPRVAIYDCVDDHAGYGGTSSKSFIEAAEGKLSASCDIVFATAKALAKKLAKHNPNTIYMPNAVDPSLFAQQPPAPELANIPLPRVVYAGALRWWFDPELLLEVANARPNVSFVVIGEERNSELGESGAKLRNLPNTFFLGKRPQRELPSLMSGASCGIIPFKVSDLISSVSPLKLYEYASMGLPTVSVPMEEVLDMPDEVVRIANTAKDFGGWIDKLIEEGPDKKALESFVAQNTWEARFQIFEKELGKAWEKRSGSPR